MIWQVPYQPAVGASHLPVEVLTFADLRQMDRSGRRRGLQRPTFHVFALVEAGAGTHRADFVDYDLLPGSVAWLRPGMVHAWTDVDEVQGRLVLFTATAAAVADSLSRSGRPITWHLGAEQFALARSAVNHLAVEHEVAVANPVLSRPAVLRHVLAGLLLRVAPVQTTVIRASATSLCGEFERLLEEHVVERRGTAWYAAQLGCSARTLNRATQATFGRSAKQLADERIALEAKRLLAYTHLTTARIATRVGFDDPGNFTTFFRRNAGTTPYIWRSQEQRTQP
ncbi:helix-turn-helix domain-containing protein [Streptomyces montanisoli]|uniref:AraC family transcriptional regulator n=1 Tax=Streptomyces montanisoli TaxID=2798581 RepID=A0A940MC95_9ACTN|nr:helix-turn-helix domain-containing protein [Streptomyces montanisoli]MBP0457002.1 AraC family transcriptional regulator [Streptomyces montanisoli]